MCFKEAYKLFKSPDRFTTCHTQIIRVYNYIYIYIYISTKRHTLNVVGMAMALARDIAIQSVDSINRDDPVQI